MNGKTMGLSIAMAGIAVYLVMTSVTSIEEEKRDQYGPLVSVLVAKTDIKEMDTLVDTMIDVRAVPQNYIEPSAIPFARTVTAESEEFQSEIKRLVGSVAVVSIKKGEQLTLNKISEPSLRTGLAPQIAPGKRAIAVSVDEVSSVGKLLKPGDRVDLILVSEVPGSRDQKQARTLFQDVVILAVGQTVTNNLARKFDIDGGRAKARSMTEYSGFNSITLELDPAQAQMLALASASSGARFQFTLRNNDDTDRQNLTTLRTSDLSGVDLRMPASSTSSPPSSGNLNVPPSGVQGGAR